ncbi:unnamed protein product, partial [Didymodactylos carnosus]
MIACPAL